MWRYKLHPPHLINVATIPCESQNTWKCNITVGYYQRKLHQTYRVRFIEMDLYIIEFAVLCNNACTEQRFVTSVTCKNAWCKLGLTLNRTLSRLPLTSGATVWDHVYVVVADTLNTCCKIIVYLYYVVHQNILWNCRCNLVHLTAILQLTLKAEFVFTCIFGVSTLTR